MIKRQDDAFSELKLLKYIMKKMSSLFLLYEWGQNEDERRTLIN
jgi:hypothetical protein